MDSIKRVIFLGIITGVLWAGPGDLYAQKKDPVVSVLYFQNTAKKAALNWLKKGLADMIITDLSQSNRLIVVEREQLQKVISEQELSMTGLTDEKAALKLGRVLNANTLVTGSFIGSGNSIRIDVKIINAETGKVKSFKAQGSLMSVFQIQDSISRKLFVFLGLDPPARMEEETSSVEAMKYYYTGMNDMDLGNHQSALKNFKYSSSIDPLYTKPQRDLEKAYRFLKDFKQARYQREISGLYKLVGKLNAHRLRKPFRTYGQIVMSEEYRSLTAEQKKRFNEKNLPVVQYQSPAHCTWAMQQKMLDIVNKKREYFSENLDREENALSKERRAMDSRQRTESREFRKRERAMRARHRDEMKELKTLTDTAARNKRRTALKAKHKEEKEIMASESKKILARKEREKKIYYGKRDSLKQKKEKLEADQKKFRDSILKKIVAVARDARTRYKNDRFLPEILYTELLAFNQMEDYASVKHFAEKFLKSYPDHRMVWAVEDFYEKSLEKMKR